MHHVGVIEPLNAHAGISISMDSRGFPEHEEFPAGVGCTVPHLALYFARGSSSPQVLDAILSIKVANRRPAVRRMRQNTLKQCASRMHNDLAATSNHTLDSRRFPPPIEHVHGNLQMLDRRVVKRFRCFARLIDGSSKNRDFSCLTQIAHILPRCPVPRITVLPMMKKKDR